MISERERLVQPTGHKPDNYKNVAVVSAGEYTDSKNFL